MVRERENVVFGEDPLGPADGRRLGREYGRKRGGDLWLDLVANPSRQTTAQADDNAASAPVSCIWWKNKQLLARVGWLNNSTVSVGGFVVWFNCLGLWNTVELNSGRPSITTNQGTGF